MALINPWIEKPRFRIRRTGKRMLVEALNCYAMVWVHQNAEKIFWSTKETASWQVPLVFIPNEPEDRSNIVIKSVGDLQSLKNPEVIGIFPKPFTKTVNFSRKERPRRCSSVPYVVMRYHPYGYQLMNGLTPAFVYPEFRYPLHRTNKGYKR